MTVYFLLASLLSVLTQSKPLSDCYSQMQCMEIDITALSNQQYELCIYWDKELPECIKSDTISHACPTDGGTKIEGWSSGSSNAMCETVSCGERAMFGVKDGSQCKESLAYGMISDTIVTCYTGGTCGGNDKACRWSIPAPDCDDTTTTTTTEAETTTTTTTEAETTTTTTAAPDTTDAPVTDTMVTDAATTDLVVTDAVVTDADTTNADTTNADTTEEGAITTDADTTEAVSTTEWICPCEGVIDASTMSFDERQRVCDGTGDCVFYLEDGCQCHDCDCAEIQDWGQGLAATIVGGKCNSCANCFYDYSFIETIDGTTEVEIFCTELVPEPPQDPEFLFAANFYVRDAETGLNSNPLFVVSYDSNSTTEEPNEWISTASTKEGEREGNDAHWMHISVVIAAVLHLVAVLRL